MSADTERAVRSALGMLLGVLLFLFAIKERSVGGVEDECDARAI